MNSSGRQEIKIPLYVGSKNRVEFPLGKKLRGHYLLVEPSEFVKYKMSYNNSHQLIKLEKDNGGFGFLLNSMLKHAKERGHEYILFCDDDILGFSRRDKKPVDLNVFFGEAVNIMREKGYSQLMMSFQGHNWFYKDTLKEKIGAWCCFVMKVDDALQIGGYDETLPIYNDWDISANLIQHGFKTACWYAYMFDHKMKSQKGGASSLYRQETLNKAEEILALKYGRGCLTTKEIHGQKEIRFKWSEL